MALFIPIVASSNYNKTYREIDTLHLYCIAIVAGDITDLAKECTPLHDSWPTHAYALHSPVLFRVPSTQ